jgi:hypothetical protein
VVIDGVDALPPAEPFPNLPRFPASSQVVASIGARYSAGTSPTELLYDDVVIATAGP